MKIQQVLILFGIDKIFGQECENVYPQLSCGKSYDNSGDCLAVGCCWSGKSCYIPRVSGYSFTQEINEPSHITGTLDLIQDSGLFSSYGNDFQQLSLDITLETSTRTHMKITPVGESRWEVPETILPRPGGIYNSSSDGNSLPGSLVTTPLISSTSPFEMVVKRSNSGSMFSDYIFNLTSQLIFKDQYLQFVLQSPDDISQSFGFGESTRSTQRLVTETTYALWASDILAATFNTSLYGVHPFIIQIKNNGRCNGIFFLNSNAMQLTLNDSPQYGKTLGIQSTGGVLDIYVFSGPTPQSVVSQYLQVIGRPAMVPYWSLGFHNCRWGYKNLTIVEEVVANYSKAGIPLETEWVDIDYMNAYLDFTTDPINFPQDRLEAFVNQLHANNQHFVPIVDPGIYALDSTYPAYTEGVDQKVFITAIDNQPYLGQVWPGPTYFPDWFATNTQSWWTSQFSSFQDIVYYDGIWIDMNEVSNFCNPNGGAQVCTEDPTCSQPDGCCVVCTTTDPTNKYDFPPFIPDVYYSSLGSKTLAQSSYHETGDVEYNAHSLYGFMESIATRNSLLSLRPNVRPFILSRSTFPGSGVYTAHWTGDNAATWEDLAASIITMNNMALFGIPMIGADICGFSGTTTEELCTRWIEVGAFSPFSRDHNEYNAPPQELYRWDTVTKASIVVLGLRYQLLPHLYSLMYEAHEYGRTVHNALWMHFPQDPITHTDTDGQYMWSGSILFTPVLKEGALSVVGYFPTGVWYSLLDDTMIDSSSGGQFVSLDTPLLTTNVHARGGHVIPMQKSGMTTSEVKSSPFRLIVTVPKIGEYVAGRLYLDDGNEEEVTEKSIVNYFSNSGNSLTSTVEEGSNYFLSSSVLSSIEIWGVNISEPYCTSSLTLTSSKVVIKASSVEIVDGVGFDKLIITFDTINSPVNIVTDYTVSWSCSSEEDKTLSNDDDESGWDSLPKYGQILIIVGICVVALGVLGGGYVLYSKKKESLEGPLLGA